MLENLAHGFSLIASWQIIAVIIIGVAVGIAGGAMPGMSAASTVALLVPFTFTMSPMASLVLLTAVYSGATYGGSITAIGINTPGTPEAAVMTMDGYALTKQGVPGKGLGISVISATIAGMVSTILLILISLPLASIALSFGPPEYFALAFFGLSIISSLAKGGILKGFISAFFGLVVTIIGLDPIVGTLRFTFGSTSLINGIPFIPALIGLFAVSEVFVLVREGADKAPEASKVSASPPNFKEFLEMVPFIGVGIIVGLLVGIMPGAGATVASIIAYGVAKKMSRHPERFGHGALEGIATPEAADKASVSGALVPLLTLGIPGSSTTAVLIGAFMIQGIAPGPLLFKEHPDLVYSLFASLFAANAVLLILGYFGIPLFIRLIRIPKNVMAVAILAITTLGAYADGGNMASVWIVFLFGVIGYIMKCYDIPPAPAVLAMVLGPMVETNFRQSMILSNSNLSIFMTRPVALALILIGILSFIWPIIQDVRASISAKKTGNIEAVK
ncbi:MAG: tripartite tricarboxylate transporter permease [Desulfitobacteriaceae bacterium]